MREFVLNDASIAVTDQRTAIDWLADIAKGMSSLVVEKIAQNTLRTSRSLQEIHYRENSSLSEAIIKVDFYELHDDESSEVRAEETFEEIDNLARSNHAPPICERHRQSLRDQITSSAELWNNRKQAFPNLLFGPDVEDHLARLNTGDLGTIVGKLAGLNAAAAEWPEVGGGVPQWKSKVTDESESLKNNAKKREKRRFKSCDGTHQLFLWHARFGDSGRIHLRFDPSLYEIEIGYIGLKLRL